VLERRNGKEIFLQQKASIGTASRFFFNADYVAEQLEEADSVFYCAKAGRKERDAGLKGFEEKENPHSTYGIHSDEGLEYNNRNLENRTRKEANNHPTVKPINLCQHLATLLLPPEVYAPRRILIPFSGSGSEMIACLLAGWEEIVGIEAEKEYVEIARARINYWQIKIPNTVWVKDVNVVPKKKVKIVWRRK